MQARFCVAVPLFRITTTNDSEPETRELIVWPETVTPTSAAHSAASKVLACCRNRALQRRRPSLCPRQADRTRLLGIREPATERQNLFVLSRCHRPFDPYLQAREAREVILCEARGPELGDRSNPNSSGDREYSFGLIDDALQCLCLCSLFVDLLIHWVERCPE